MNTQLIAVALRALADAIETPSAPATTAAKTAVATDSTPAASTTAPAAARPRGRPPGAAKPAAPTTAAVAATPAPAVAPTAAAAAPAAPAAAPASAAATPGNSLTHASVANDFKAAALAHGRDFVKGLLTAHGAPTFDKVKDLATFQQQLKAGPQAAPAAVDATDLLG